MNPFKDRKWFKPAKSARLNESGHETLSPKPMALPVGIRAPETLAETVARLVRSEQWNQAMRAQGIETLEEANDFDMDDEEPWSPHELVYDPVADEHVSADIFKARGETYRAAAEKRKATPPAKPKGPRSAPKAGGEDLSDDPEDQTSSD